ncbi:15 hydroxyprostaglandin dehydrogenase NAD+ [Aspergillus fumigatus]|nr:15 hydroxyprostaglandin dehydrogenase NAD+ [Aspergillus fumigatus]
MAVGCSSGDSERYGPYGTDSAFLYPGPGWNENEVRTNWVDTDAHASIFIRNGLCVGRRQAGIADTQFLYNNDYRYDENGLPLPVSLQTLDVNLTAVIQGVWLFKHYARRNKVAGGKVVITSSSAGLYPMESNPIYTASKHALVGLTRALGPVLQRQNIQVNAICPAFVPTGLCPKEMLGRFPKEHMIPSSKTMAFLDRLWN